MASATTPSQAATGSDNSFARIFGALFSPKPTFASIVQRPTWVVPVILGCILFIAVVFIFTAARRLDQFFSETDGGQFPGAANDAGGSRKPDGEAGKIRAHFWVRGGRGPSASGCIALRGRAAGHF